MFQFILRRVFSLQLVLLLPLPLQLWCCIKPLLYCQVKTKQKKKKKEKKKTETPVSWLSLLNLHFSLTKVELKIKMIIEKKKEREGERRGKNRMLLGLWPSREAVFLCFYKTKKKKKRIQTPFWSNQYLTLLSFANKRFGTTYINFINKHIVQWRLLLLFSFCFSFVLFLLFSRLKPLLFTTVANFFYC